MVVTVQGCRSIIYEQRGGVIMKDENIICDLKARCLDYPACCTDCENNERQHYYKPRRVSNMRLIASSMGRKTKI